jgi:predicted Zn-dependent protease
MKAAAIALSAAFLVAPAAPAHAQLGGALGKIKKQADKAADAKQKLDDVTFTEAEERQIGEGVSDKLRQRFGVYQDEKVTRYVTLVGTVLTQSSSRPGLQWKFIVLDTDGVNAYAAPGGLVHVTRGLLGLLKNEAELAGVLGHEITHITEKHTINAIQRSKITSEVSDKAGGGSLKNQLIAKAIDRGFQDIFDGQFSQGDEKESDKVGVQIANKVGYAPSGLASALQKVEDRNAGNTERNGWFASHPAIKERIAAVHKQITAEKLTSKALVEARYKQTITFDAKPLTEIAVDVAGAAGLASGNKKQEDTKADAKPDDKSRGKLGLNNITGGSKQAQNTQQTSSAGARGLGNDRDAKGGGNANALSLKVTPAEIVAFKQGIA